MVPADCKSTDSIHIISNDHLYIASVYERLDLTPMQATSRPRQRSEIDNVSGEEPQAQALIVEWRIKPSSKSGESNQRVDFCIGMTLTVNVRVSAIWSSDGIWNEG